MERRQQRLRAAGERARTLSNNQFGTVVINTRYDPEIITGWANRPYNWQGAASLQQQLRPGLAVLVAYYRTWYGNFSITDNLSQTPAAFDPFCVTAPADARLPEGGGYQLCDLYNINHATFGQNTAGNLVRPASEFGEPTEVYNGLEFSFTSRFGRGGLVSGGVSTGQTVIDNCLQVDYPGQLQTGATIQPLAFCKNTLPWAGQTQVKLSGAYPLPWWGLQASGVFQNIPGVAILASRTFTNTEIAGSLGRNLSSCPNAVGACTATQTIAMIEPNTLREERLMQVDARLTKTFQLGGVRLQGMFDVYNIFNENSVLTRNNTFGATWGRPTRILGARLIKFGAQLDF